MTRIWIDPRYDTPSFRAMLQERRKGDVIMGKVDPAGLASPGSVATGSAGPARAPGYHAKQGEQ